MSFFLRSLAVFGIISVCSSTVIADTQAPHVVIMLDITGSTSLSDLAIERNAAKSIVEQFMATPLRPFVAIGSFNVAEENSARIVPGGELTNDYGTSVPPTGLFAAIDGIQTAGGMTDLSAAINLGRAQLDFAPPGASKYLVLISDGTPNRPGELTYENCNECGCPTAYGAASSAAASAEASGIRIFGIHYAGTGFTYCNQFGEPEDGMGFMRQEIATSESYFYQGNQNLTGIFGEVFCAISCDDGNACTVDTCDSQVGQCFHTPDLSDADSDSVVDCQDQCNGNDALLGAVCGEVSVIAECTRSLGAWTCNAEDNISCQGGEVLDPATCFGCQNIDNVPAVSDLSFAVQQQSNLALSLVKRLKKSGVAEKAIKRYSAKTRKDIESIVETTSTALGTLPAKYKTCAPLVSGVCQQLNQAPALDLVRRNANSTETLIKKVGRKLRQRGALTKKDKKALRARTVLLEDIKEISSRFPAFHSECR